MRHAPHDRRRMLRMAHTLHERLAPGGAARLPHLPEGAWDRCLRPARLAAKAARAGLPLAAESLHLRLVSALAELREELDRAAPPPPPRGAAPPPTPRLLYDEIAALAAECELRLDLQEKALSVTTEPVELEGVSLGRFEIRLELGEEGELPAYRVIALDPHPAASSGGTTHPHVQDEALCEGEGRLPIRHALAEGRLYDFFQVVSQVLHTYNDGSAYVSLADWSGSPCADCGGSVSEDDACGCGRCGATLCPDCERSCRSCGSGHCGECLSGCAACEEDCCRRCLSPCADCGESCCADCLRGRVCATCRESAERDAEHAGGTGGGAANSGSACAAPGA